jgi:hypothetical protein
MGDDLKNRAKTATRALRFSPGSSAHTAAVSSHELLQE